MCTKNFVPNEHENFSPGCERRLSISAFVQLFCQKHSVTPDSFWTTVDRFTTACKVTSWHYWSKLRLMFRCFSQVTYKTLIINTRLRLVQTGVSLWVARPTSVNNGSNRTLLCWKTTKHGHSGWIYKRTGWFLVPENRYNIKYCICHSLFLKCQCLG